MSIDARVEMVIHREDGSGELRLVDRPPYRPGDYPGLAGQYFLRFDSAPHDVTALNGRDIWGGSGEIMLGDQKVAERLSAIKIRFLVSNIGEILT